MVEGRLCLGEKPSAILKSKMLIGGNQTALAEVMALSCGEEWRDWPKV